MLSYANDANSDFVENGGFCILKEIHTVTSDTHSSIMIGFSELYSRNDAHLGNYAVFRRGFRFLSNG